MLLLRSGGLRVLFDGKSCCTESRSVGRHLCACADSETVECMNGPDPKIYEVFE